MTEEDARAWIAARFDADAIARMDRLAGLVLAENERQNLISPATASQIWVRHLLDSAQLAPLAPPEGRWVDIGTGGGFPGMVVAIVRQQPTVLVEPRKRRAAFLAEAARELELGWVEVAACKVELVRVQAGVISARAVASIENLLRAALPCATMGTRWLLPRGRFDNADLARMQQGWAGVFHVEQSLTDGASSILVIDGARPR